MSIVIWHHDVHPANPRTVQDDDTGSMSPAPSLRVEPASLYRQADGPDALSSRQGLDDEVPTAEVEGPPLLGLLVEGRQLGRAPQRCKEGEAGSARALDLHAVEEG